MELDLALKFKFELENLIAMKYNLGSSLSKIGNFIDCYGMIKKISENVFGKKIPTSYNGKSYEEYCIEYKKNPELVMKDFFSFINSEFKKVPFAEKMLGDIVIMSSRKNGYRDAVGVVCGNGNVAVVTSQRDMIIIKDSAYKIMEVYRCQQQSH